MNILKTIILIAFYLSLIKPTFAVDQKVENPDSTVNSLKSDLIVLKNENGIIPLKNLNTTSIASISLGKSNNENFENSLVFGS